MATVFDIYRNVITEKEKLSDEIIQESFDVMGFNRIMSHDRMNIFLADAVNTWGLAQQKMAVYMFYFYGCDKLKKAPFLDLKKEKQVEHQELIEVAKLFLPEYSLKKIEKIFPMIKKRLQDLQKSLDYGGVQK